MSHGDPWGSGGSCTGKGSIGITVTLTGINSVDERKDGWLDN